MKKEPKMKKVTYLIALLVLSLTGSAVMAAPPSQDADGQVYTVQEDDWLSKLADKYYGDMFAYPVIVEATNAQAVEDDRFAMITNPDVIEVGQKLWIPAQAIPLAVELSDGTRCLHAGFGATLAFDGKRLNYTCELVGEDQIGLLGELQDMDGVLMAERAVIGHDASGFFLRESEMVVVGNLSYTEPGLGVEALRNAAYQGIYQEPIQLSDGKYEGKPFVEGGASRPTVDFVDLNAFGDLNGDGIDDAAVFLGENSGGSGVFVYLAAVLEQSGAPVNVATRLLGDRVQLKAVSIEDGNIVVSMITQGPDDPFCCPTLEVKQSYELQGDQLVLVSTEEVGKLSAASLGGTTWVLVSYGDFANPTSVLEGSEITAMFSVEDSQVAGSAGCNRYFANFEGTGTTLTVGPPGATTMACQEEVMKQESEYLAALETASNFQFGNGKLLLIYDGGLLTFAAK
jgi:heat shock protein HslJ